MARAGRRDRGLYIRPNRSGKLEWWVRLSDNGRDRKFGSFPTKTAAREFYEKAKKEQKEGQFFPERYHRGHSPLTETVIASHLAVSTVKNQAAEKHYGAWWTVRLKGVRLNGVSPALLEDAQRALVAAGKAPQTVLHYLKFMRHILNDAIRYGKLDRNPFDKVTLPRLPKGKTRFLSVQEEARLLETLGPTYGPWARFAILTGLRLGEQMQMRWSDVNFEEHFVMLPSTKSGEPQYAKLNQEAVAILLRLSSWQRSEHVFPSQNLARPMNQRNFTTRIFRPAVTRAKLEGVTWHTLRHTTASRAAMSGHHEGTIAALLRHRNTGLVQRYAHLHPDYLAGVLEDVAQFGKRTDISVQSGPKGEGQHRTGPKTGIEGVQEGDMKTEVFEKLERAMGFEPTTTSLGS
jgi:integrase